VVSLEEDVSSRADCITGPGAAAQVDLVDADEDVAPVSINRPQPPLDTFGWAARECDPCFMNARWPQSLSSPAC
jgi:hypothetical protein